MKNRVTARTGFFRRELYGTAGLLVGIFAALLILSRHSFLLAHALAEMYSVGVALTIFFIAWNARSYFDNGYLVFLGIAYFFIGSIDLVHTVAYRGMGFFPSFDSNLPTQLWVFARYLESLSLAAALLFISRRVRPYASFAGYAAVSAAGVAAVFLGLFPDCYIADSGLTAFKKVSEYVIAAILTATLWGVYRLRAHFQSRLMSYLVASIILTILAEMTFTTYMSVYGFSNMLGHYFKVISFYLIYRGVVVTGIRDPYALLMQRLQERNRELEESRELIWRNQKISSTMLDNIPEEIALLDGQSLEIVDVNQTFLENYGISKEEAIGRTCHRVTHSLEAPCSGSDHLCPLFEEVPFGRPLVHCHRRDGEELRYVEIIVVPVEEDGGERQSARQYVHIARDITERRRTEQMREDIERVIRHDLKSPLNGIIGSAELLRQEENLQDDQREMAEAIYESGMSVLRMVNESLDIYKMAEGSYRLQPELFDLSEVLQRLAGRWTAKRSAKKLSLSFTVGGEPPEQAGRFLLYAEQQSIERLLANLIENALDASPAGETVQVSAERRSGTVLLAVHNRGVIPEEVRERFFERYVTSGKRHGTGLGTYSAWLITRVHGGRIYFSTGEQEGTTVTAELPDRSQRDETGSSDG